MSYEKEEDERSEINRDRLGGEGVLDTHRMHTPLSSLLTPHLFAPPHHYVVPSPYKQGESAVRYFFTLCKGYSLLLTTYYLLLTTYSSLLTKETPARQA